MNCTDPGRLPGRPQSSALAHNTPSARGICRDDIVAAARRYKGAPFKMAGRSRHGLDCVGLPLLVARDLALPGWRVLWGDMACHAYPTVRAVGFLRGKLDGFVERGVLRRIDKSACAPGDLVLSFGGFGHDHHVGILTPDGLLEARNTAEARHPTGRVVEHDMTAAKWRSVIQGYQFTGVA